MEKKTTRLYFIDAIRAWAILMMLQGHFVDGLLDNAYRDASNDGYNLWKYFRGMTAPVFFTVSGFIFTYLLIRVPQTGIKNPRIKKGIKRGLELLFIGYLLRINFKGLIHGEIYNAFYLVDVLHCIGLSILGVVVLYLLTYRHISSLFPLALLAVTVLLFLFEPIYSKMSFEFLPDALANYVTKKNGSVFTIIPWFGYASFGAFASVLFTRYKEDKYLYPAAISISLIVGLMLIFFSSNTFMWISKQADIDLLSKIYYNNYLFIRLGDVLVSFAVFMIIRRWLTNATMLKIGQSTLSIYIIHFIILYGSFTGLGLYQYFHNSLTPVTVIVSAIVFMIVCSFTALLYEKHKAAIKSRISHAMRFVFTKAKIVLVRLFGLVKN